MLETAVSRVLFLTAFLQMLAVTTICLSLLPGIHRAAPLGFLFAVAALPTLLFKLRFAVRTDRLLNPPERVGGAARTFLFPLTLLLSERSSPLFPTIQFCY